MAYHPPFGLARPLPCLVVQHDSIHPKELYMYVCQGGLQLPPCFSPKRTNHQLSHNLHQPPTLSVSEIAGKQHHIHTLLELHLSIVPVVMNCSHDTSQNALCLTSTLIARTNSKVNKNFSIHCDMFILLRLTHDFLINKIHAFY